MARLQPITRLVDALDAQQRIVLWLECTHKVSLSAMTIACQPRGFLEELRLTTRWTCPFCPDPPPEAPSAQRLYRRAYEPDIR